MNVILIAVIVLGAIGLIAALVLFLLSKKFAVKEDPRLGEVLEALPGANCGGCGFPGCGGLAAACVKAADAGSLEGLNCPVGGQPVMEKVASILGMKVEASAPKLAVVRCNGTCSARPRIAEYDGVQSCKIANSTSMGETGCAFGCLGCGDCVAACQFDAIHMNSETGLPEVDATKCTACGACAKACPRNIIEIRTMVGDEKTGVVVLCMNKEKGAVAKKACASACIGCQKCVKVCPADAVHVDSFLAYIDPEKCIMCRECEKECPQGVILGLNLPELSGKSSAAPKAASPASDTKKSSTPKPKTFKSKTNSISECQKMILESVSPLSPDTSINPTSSNFNDAKIVSDIMPKCQLLLLTPSKKESK